MTARRKLYVHIGMHKTGTSSIQYALHEQSDSLRNQGILYPVTGRHPIAHVQHDLLYRALSDKVKPIGIFEITNMPDADELFSALLAEIALTDCHTVILSAENLWTLKRQEVERFASYFSDFEIVPVMFIRRTSDLVESLYLTNSRIGATNRDSEVLGFEFWAAYLRMDIRNFVKIWAGISSAGKVIIHSFDCEGTDSIQTFWEILNLPRSAMPGKMIRYNQTQSKISEFIRLLCNRHGVDREQREILMKKFQRLHFDNNRITLMPPQVRRQFDRSYIEQVQSLCESDMVKTTDQSKWILHNPIEPIFLDGMLTALFVIGAALEGDPRLN